MAALFVFEDVAVRTDAGDDILRDVSAEVEADGITVLLGPSGAGKSTLLRLCNRLGVPDAGMVRYRGRDVADLDPLTLRREVGMVFQRPTVFAGTVGDNLRVAAPDAGDDRLAGLLRRVDLDGSVLDQDADSLSGGEAQRVCLARALANAPDVLLMDEPTSSLDQAARLVLERLARELAEGGTPMLWVTHDLEQARRIGDRVLVLVDGAVVDQGTPAEVLDDPSRDVSRFLGNGAE